jgi:hypothetical protein
MNNECRYWALFIAHCSLTTFRSKPMSMAIQIDDELYSLAKQTTQGEYRNADAQIAFWARIGKAALENPDLPIEFIIDILVSKKQDRALAEPFVPGGKHA